MLEECRNIYLGKTTTHVNVYLGNASAKLAAFLYEKAGIRFELQKTDIFASVSDFSYLARRNMTVFKNDGSDIVADIKTFLEAYDVLQRHGKVDVIDQDFSYKKLQYDHDHIMYNTNEKLTIYVPHSEFPTPYNDSIITCLEWSTVSQYKPEDLETVDVTGEKYSNAIRRYFHQKPYNRSSKKISAFNDLYGLS